MLFAAKRNDISEQVLRQINRAAKREEATNKREKKEIEKKEMVLVFLYLIKTQVILVLFLQDIIKMVLKYG